MTSDEKAFAREPEFVWPDPRFVEPDGSHRKLPPCVDFAKEAKSIFGIVASLTSKGLEVLGGWLEENKKLQMRLMMTVYPTCETKGADLQAAQALSVQSGDRLKIRVCALPGVADRSTNALCFVSDDSSARWMTVGASEDLGLGNVISGNINLTFSPSPSQIESFREYFDRLWNDWREMTDDGVTTIPDLVLPHGSSDAARQWGDYISACKNPVPVTRPADRTAESANAPDTNDRRAEVKTDSPVADTETSAFVSPTEEIGVKPLDEVELFATQLYAKGALVSLDRLSRIPPLSAPLSPTIFGDVSELQKGNVKRRVEFRVSVLDESTLKKVEKLRTRIAGLLPKFTFALAEGTRWMPSAARALFEGEAKRTDDDGRALIAKVFGSDSDAMVDARRLALIKDLNGLYAQLDRPGEIPDDVVKGVMDDLKERFRKAGAAKFVPDMSFSVVTPLGVDRDYSSKWGQAFRLLSDILSYPRKALTSPFFLQGVAVREDELLMAMNVADDALLRDYGKFGLKERCKEELLLLKEIEDAPLALRDRYEFALRILRGKNASEIRADLERESSEAAKSGQESDGVQTGESSNEEHLDAQAKAATSNAEIGETLTEM